MPSWHVPDSHLHLNAKVWWIRSGKYVHRIYKGTLCRHDEMDQGARWEQRPQLPPAPVNRRTAPREEPSCRMSHENPTRKGGPSWGTWGSLGQCSNGRLASDPDAPTCSSIQGGKLYEFQRHPGCWRPAPTVAPSCRAVINVSLFTAGILGGLCAKWSELEGCYYWLGSQSPRHMKGGTVVMVKLWWVWNCLLKSRLYTNIHWN
jgi:hypothetical protein